MADESGPQAGPEGRAEGLAGKSVKEEGRARASAPVSDDSIKVLESVGDGWDKVEMPGGEIRFRNSAGRITARAPRIREEA